MLSWCRALRDRQIIDHQVKAFDVARGFRGVNPRDDQSNSESKEERQSDRIASTPVYLFIGPG
ncbi:MAG: hypothetical protein QOE39_4300 [Bradyrhizobium sp.]|nr:hypothetical protein [Bradyrhizobium sp.]